MANKKKKYYQFLKIGNRIIKNDCNLKKCDPKCDWYSSCTLSDKTYVRRPGSIRINGVDYNELCCLDSCNKKCGLVDRCFLSFKLEQLDTIQLTIKF